MLQQNNLICKWIEKVEWNLSPFSLTDFHTGVFLFNQKKLTSIQNLLFCLNHSEIIRYHQFYFEKDRNNFLLGRFGIKSLASALTGQALHEFEIVQPAHHAKPYLVNLKLPLFFNISHSADYVLLAVSLIDEVGIDVECSGFNKGIKEVVQAYFTENEIIKLEKASDYLTSFREIWTRKEAFVKLLGGHLLEQIKSFDVSGEQSEIPGNYLPEKFSKIFLNTFYIDNQIPACVATTEKNHQIAFYIVDDCQIEKWAEKLKSGLPK